MPRLRARLAALERRRAAAHGFVNIIVRLEPGESRDADGGAPPEAAGKGNQPAVVIRRVNRAPSPVTR